MPGMMLLMTCCQTWKKNDNPDFFNYRQILLMFVKQIFEDFEHFENRKRVTLTRPAIAGR